MLVKRLTVRQYIVIAYLARRGPSTTRAIHRKIVAISPLDGLDGRDSVRGLLRQLVRQGLVESSPLYDPETRGTVNQWALTYAGLSANATWSRVLLDLIDPPREKA